MLDIITVQLTVPVNGVVHTHLTQLNGTYFFHVEHYSTTQRQSVPFRRGFLAFNLRYRPAVHYKFVKYGPVCVRRYGTAFFHRGDPGVAEHGAACPAVTIRTTDPRPNQRLVQNISGIHIKTGRVETKERKPAFYRF